MANDKELSTNDEVKRNKDFQSRVDMKESVLDIVKEILISSTEAAFKPTGVDKKDGHAGEYGDGTTYGTGAQEGKLNIKIAGKTKSFLQKEIVFGTKSVISIVNIAFNENSVSIEYKSPEAGFFRGVDDHGKTYMVNEKFQLPTSDISKFKTELQSKLLAFAKKELGYLTSTKIGVDDKTEKSTTSVVESIKQNSNMKKLTIKELFSDELTEGVDNKEKNTVDLKDTKPAVKNAGDKKLVFDEEKDEKENVQKEITTSGPAISNSPGGFKDGAPSGAGGYNTNKAWKKTPYGKSKTESRPKITKDWKVVASESKDKDSKSDNTEVTEKKTSKSEGGVSEPKDKPNFDTKTGNSSYKNTNQTKAPSSDKDGFWTEIDLIPGTGYVPKGMDQNYIAGMHDASAGDIKKRGYSEGEEKGENLLNENKAPITSAKPGHTPDLTRKKFFSLEENQEKGINKRYLITEKTSEEYQRERWKKLSSFKTYESIKEAEEMNDFFDSLQENKQPFVNPLTLKRLTENVSHDDIFNDETTPVENKSEDTVIVEKPNSKFGLEYKFFKEDFLNESKHYILDLNSKVYVKNPNAK